MKCKNQAAEKRTHIKPVDEILWKSEFPAALLGGIVKLFEVLDIGQDVVVFGAFSEIDPRFMLKHRV